MIEGSIKDDISLDEKIVEVVVKKNNSLCVQPREEIKKYVKALVQKGGSGFEDNSQKFEDHKKCV